MNYRVEMGHTAWARMRTIVPAQRPALTTSFGIRPTQTAVSLAAWELSGMPIWIVYAMHPRAWQIIDNRGRIVNGGRVATPGERLEDALEQVSEQLRRMSFSFEQIRLMERGK